MKVLHVIGDLDEKNGGTFTALCSIIKVLDELGLENFIITTEKEGSVIKNPILKNRYLKFQRSFPGRFTKSKLAKKWLKDNITGFDALFVHEIWGGLALDACLMALKKKVKYYIWPHGSLDPFDLQKKHFLKQIVGKLIVNNILLHAEHICCTSSLEKERIVYFGKKKQNGIVLPLSVNKPEGMIGKREKFREKYQLNNCLVYLFLSRINYKKGLELIIQSFAGLRDEGNWDIKKVKLVIAGIGSEQYTSKIKLLIAQLQLEDTVIFTGMLTGQEKEDAFSGSDIFLLPSMNENFGLSIVESLQSGLPVIISDNVYIHKEILAGHTCGWLCKFHKDSLMETLKLSSAVVDLKDYSKQAIIAGNKFLPEQIKINYKSSLPQLCNSNTY